MIVGILFGIMFRTFGYSLLFAAMFVIAGGHLFVIQAVAWSTMIVKYSEGASVVEAVEKTFSGKAPCKLCKVVESGRSDQSKVPLTIKSDKKIESFLAATWIVCAEPDSQKFQYPRSADETFPSRSHEPPQQVPISKIS